MHMRTFQLIFTSQIILLLTLFICVLIIPEIVTTLPQGGLSNYGTSSRVTWIFSTGFWIAIVLQLLAARRHNRMFLRRVLFGSALLLALLVVSTYPYKVNPFFENVHILVGFIVALYQLVTAWLLIKRNHFDGVSKLVAVFFLGSIVTGLSTIFAIGLLFTSQLLGGIGYGILLVHSAYNNETGAKNVQEH